MEPGMSGLAQKRNDFPFQGDQPAASMTIAPQPARTGQQIEVRHAAQMGCQIEPV